MGQSVSIYFPSEILDWVDDQAKDEKRSRSNQIRKYLVDIKDRLKPVESGTPEEIEQRKTRLPPSART